MRAFAFAWRSLARQPARTVLALLGIAAVGALLFDMLLLSRGLVVSFSELLEETGFDVRVTATDSMPVTGPMILDAAAAARALEGLPEVEQASPLRVARAEARVEGGEPIELTLMGLGSNSRDLWTVVAGAPLPSETGWVVINDRLARELAVAPGDTLSLWDAGAPGSVATPAIDLRVAGIAEFAFDTRLERTAAVRLSDLSAVCALERAVAADVLLVASAAGSGPEQTVEAIRRLRPDLHAFSNVQLVNRFRAHDFSYFRQISVVLTTVTLSFAFLLITSLLTVSVNQRFAEVAALRAIGFSRARVVADLFCQSVLLVGGGGLVAIPLGAALAVWLDGILKSMAHIPVNLHFFVFQPRALVLHVALLGLVGMLAALYPIYLAARLPIAATLRNEVVS